MIFELDDEEAHKAASFIESKMSDKKYEGAIGGRFTYSFTPTSLGTVSKVRDNISGEELDVTDYKMW